MIAGAVPRAAFPVLAVTLFLQMGLRAPAQEWSPYKLPARAPSVPAVETTPASSNPIDAFLAEQWKVTGILPASQVDRRTWIRRATYDLTGLPPTPEEVQDFLNDRTPDAEARSKVVDRLLASEHYGERAARLWLDVVRYADTDGFAIDGERATLWRYRDYVIRAFNQDRPWNQVIREHLAGDELGYGAEGVVATSFYRLGPYELDNMTPEHRRQDFLNEMTSAIGSAFLGLTIGCARCHDHKFDPIPQRDFYRLQAFVGSADRADVPAAFLVPELTPSVEAQREVADKAVAAAKKEFADYSQKLRQKFSDAGNTKTAMLSEDDFEDAVDMAVTPITEEEKKKYFELRKEVRQHKGNRLQPVAVTIVDPKPGDKVYATHVLRNGDPFNPAEEVSPGVLESVETWSADLAESLENCGQSPAGRRKVLAEWVASPRNPLTGRVFVNRIWQQHFGQGIVATPNDFGLHGIAPSHPELLDWLAIWFTENGWSVKKLHRLIVLSNAYGLASEHPQSAAVSKVDPDNRLLTHANPRRHDSETIRDAFLAVSGQLNPEQGGPGFYEALPSEMEIKYEFFEWHASSRDQRNRRSIYMFQRRNLVHPLMETFDGADINQSCERRKVSVTAPQALTLLNSEFAARVGEDLANRVESEAGTDANSQVMRVFELTYNRPPESEEQQWCEEFLSKRRQQQDQLPPAAPVHAVESERVSVEQASHTADPALAELCRIVLNTSEFLYLD